MAWKITTKRNGISLVKKDAHSAHGCRRAAGDLLKHQPCLLLRHTREQADKLAQRDPILHVHEQGPDRVRVPRNIHAPLTSSGPQWPDLIGKGDPHQQIAQGCWIVNVGVVKVGDRDHLNSPSPAPGPEWPAQRGLHCVSGPSAACRPEDHSGGSAGGCPRCERGASLSSVDRSGTDETHSHGDGEGNTRCADDLLKPAEFLRPLLTPGLDRGPQRPGGQGQPDRAEGALDAPHPGGGGDQR